MKKLIVGLALVASMNVTAAPKSCLEWSNFAGSAMQQRQSGALLSDAIEGVINPAERKVIIAAYKNPLFSTQEYKLGMVRDFKNKIMLQCLEVREN